MVREFSKLMLRAYNNEADNAIRSTKPYTLESSVARLDKARQITDSYHVVPRLFLAPTRPELAHDRRFVPGESP